MDRRTFLAGGLALLAGCGGDDASSPSSAPGSSTPPGTASLVTRGSTTTTGSGPTGSGPAGSTPTSASASTGSSTTSIARVESLDELAASMRGRLLLPGGVEAEAYDRARLLFDPEFDPVRPAAVARVADASDVQRCVEFAATTGTAITARSGGHSYIGASTVAGGLVVDLRDLASVDPGPRSGPAVIGPGAALIDVYAGLAASGRAIPAGTCPSVGVAGLTLGGGVGVTGRAWGLTCDNLVAANVVVADGSLVRASEEENDDLLWALRGGGGGTVGIVTGFEFDTHPADDVVTFFLRWDPVAASQILPAWMSWAPSGPDELWSNCVFGIGSQLRLTMVGAWLGAEGSLDALLDELVAAAGVSPSARSVRSRGYLDAMRFMAGCTERTITECHLGPALGGIDGGELGREEFAAKSAYLGAVPDDVGIETFSAVLDRDRAPGQAGNITMIIDSNGGAISRVGPEQTAFPHRETIASIQFYGGWSRPELAEPTRRWLDRAHADLGPWTTGGAYVNYPDRDLTDSDAAYYGTNAARLAEVKQRWDPDRRFDVGQIIAT